MIQQNEQETQCKMQSYRSLRSYTLIQYCILYNSVHMHIHKSSIYSAKTIKLKREFIQQRKRKAAAYFHSEIFLKKRRLLSLTLLDAYRWGLQICIHKSSSRENPVKVREGRSHAFHYYCSLIRISNHQALTFALIFLSDFQLTDIEQMSQTQRKRSTSIHLPEAELLVERTK